MSHIHKLFHTLALYENELASAKGKIIESFYIHFVHESKNLFLGESITPLKAVPFSGDVPLYINLKSSYLCYPTKENNPSVDAILVRKKGDMNIVSFLHITIIYEGSSFTNKINEIQRKLGIRPRRTRTQQNPTNAPNDPAQITGATNKSLESLQTEQNPAIATRSN